MRESRRSFLRVALAASAAGSGLPGLAPSRSARAAPGSRKHTLVVLDPGHFHAALTLRESHPRLADEVFVYAEDGPDLESFLRIVRTFNERAADPTRWRLAVHRGPDFLERLRSDRPGDVVVIASRNDRKMASIRRLHADGFFVLGDKPWLIGADLLGMLREVAGRPPLAMDIMTERHQIATLVQKALVERPAVFGEFRARDALPALEFRSVHHLYKTVNDRPLVRPPWFFDTAAQGEGITDVTTHLVDLAQWMTGRGKPFEYGRDVELLSARQWPTGVPLGVFSRITGLAAFPPAVRARVEGDTLHYLCNAEIAYRLRGLPVRIESLWNLAIPEGGGDTHQAIARGTGADLVVDQGPETGFLTRLTVRPVASGTGLETALADAVASLQGEFPGLGVARDGAVYRVTMPEALRSRHEAHFAAVLEEFISYLDGGRWPENLGPDLVTKYTLLARARQLSHRGT